MTRGSFPLFARRRRNDPLESLTVGEREVLALVAEGRSNRTISETLTIAERTVESDIKQIFDKLGLLDDPDTNRRILAAPAILRPELVSSSSRCGVRT